MPVPFGVSSPPSSTFTGTGQAVRWTWPEAAAEIEAGTTAGEAVVAAEEVAAPFIAIAPEVLLPALLAAALLPSIGRHFQTPPGLPDMEIPFHGGQSSNYYHIVFERQASYESSPQTGTLDHAGPINGVYARPSSPGTKDTYAIQFGDGTEYGIGSLSVGGGDADWLIIPHIVSVTRVDGQPDTGGDPLPRFKPASTPAFTQPKSIPLPGGLTLPINPTLVPYNVPSKVQPDSPAKPDPHEQFPAPVVVRIPELSLDVHFTPDGVQLVPEFEPQFTGEQSASPSTRNPAPPASSSPEDECKCTPEIDGSKDDLDAIKKELDDIKKCACGPEYEIITQSLGAGTGGSYGLPDMSLFVTLTLTTIPSNARTQSGDGGPDVWYAGWHSFGSIGNVGGERIPINFAANTFFVPDNATTFAFTVTTGFTASATVTYKRKKI